MFFRKQALSLHRAKAGVQNMQAAHRVGDLGWNVGESGWKHFWFMKHLVELSFIHCVFRNIFCAQIIIKTHTGSHDPIGGCHLACRKVKSTLCWSLAARKPPRWPVHYCPVSLEDHCLLTEKLRQTHNFPQHIYSQVEKWIVRPWVYPAIEEIFHNFY